MSYKRFYELQETEMDVRIIGEYICKDLALITPYSNFDINIAYKRLASIDNLIEAIWYARSHGMTLSEAVDVIQALNDGELKDAPIIETKDGESFLND